MTRSRALVLCYHAVSESWFDELAIEPQVLVEQVRRLLRRGRQPGSAADVLAGRPILHVTFDDAFRNVSSVLPGLVQLGVPVTLFACPGFADGGLPFLVSELRERTEGFHSEVRTMSWDELRASAAMGVEIGSHTVSHPHLTSLSDAELELELRQSKQRLEDETGAACRFLAYPYGEHDARVRAAAQAAGYVGAFALQMTDGSPFAIPRVDLYRSDGRSRVALKTSALYRPIQATIAKMRRAR